MADFKKIHRLVMVMEGGGWSNAKFDLGGETYRGITKKYHPGWDGWKLIDEMKYKDNFEDWKEKIINDKELIKLAESFYKKEWWDLLRLDEIENDRIALEIYEMAINCGSFASIKNLQKCLNLLNNNQRYWEDILEDGKIGPKTISVTNKAMSFITLGYIPKNLIKLFNCEQGHYYVGICLKNKEQEINLHGWLNMRVDMDMSLKNV